ncbi:unnamed protein product [Chilo suppressalis]|uniref:Uncharacterized protein n=1 Tax=Chilo suppressalis TaxID=168631 RepID=A0ABN8AWY9_CHISP|nr:hypothetical protein evm_004075 [Chilo suppressalis]CAH0397874.1 unnamed protein product [Chilo suppressalis]
MVEDSIPLKTDEQYPLLKVETGGGDSGRPTPSVVTPGWNVVGSQKRSWLDRWPELISAFWMSGMLLGIFCLMLYGLGLGVVRRQPILILHCNSSKPGTEVYYHHIVERGSVVPFNLISEYLSNMATLYPLLRHNIMFLMDDTLQSEYRGSRHSRFFNKLIPYHTELGNHIDENIQQQLKDFQSKHNNVNVTVVSISKYMATTPLRYRWRTIPIAYLTFYARVFSVWQNGGIGMDLEVFSAQFNRGKLPDRRISEILKQHNNGIQPDEYTNSIKKIDREEQNEVLSLFYGIVSQILNETRAFFNRTLLYSDEKDKTALEPLVRTNRNKRDTKGNISQNITNNTEKIFTTKLSNSINTTNINIVDNVYKNEKVGLDKLNTSNNVNEIPRTIRPYENKIHKIQNSSSNGLLYPSTSEMPQVWVLYDFSLLSDNIQAPSYRLPESLMQGNTPVLPTADHMSARVNHSKSVPVILSINVEGTFIAASLKQHPLLAHIVSARCQRMPPKFAIQDAVISQCSNLFRDDFYCSNIYLLY